ncbi:hypothetical protein [Campylobacter sp.]|nr:hypothetical protein [Campylobacter sp.]MDY4446530.1 hypothetical protein [Campylobacter sp.]
MAAQTAFFHTSTWVLELPLAGFALRGYLLAQLADAFDYRTP